MPRDSALLTSTAGPHQGAYHSKGGKQRLVRELAAASRNSQRVSGPAAAAAYGNGWERVGTGGNWWEL